MEDSSGLYSAQEASLGMARPVANSLNSMKQSGVFSDQDTLFMQSRLVEDDQID